jgi:uncharacterized protein with NRDE domain
VCLLAWNWQPEADMPLLLLSNRDEFYDREAAPMHWWGSGSTVLAGKDLQAGGTWLGVSRDGRLAALTNFRSGAPAIAGRPSRGQLVSDFLEGGLSGANFLNHIASAATAYNPFTLLVFDRKTLLGLESRAGQVVTLQPGIGGLSNAGLNTPWPKLLRLKEGLKTQLDLSEGRIPCIDTLRHLLHDRAVSPDGNLPKTGVPPDLERTLSPIFITSPRYGTRASSLVALQRSHALFSEETYGPAGVQGRRSLTFFYATNE